MEMNQDDVTAITEVLRENEFGADVELRYVQDTVRRSYHQVSKVLEIVKGDPTDKQIIQAVDYRGGMFGGTVESRWTSDGKRYVRAMAYTD